MTMYIVAQRGVYTHDLVGVFDSLEGAKAGAVAAARSDDDDYHTYEVYPFALNEVTTTQPESVFTTSLWTQADKDSCEHKFGMWRKCRKCGFERAAT